MVLCWALCFHLLCLPLALCFSPTSPDPPAFYPLPVFVSLRWLLLLRLADDSWGWAGRLLRGTRAPLFVTVVGVESGTQEFQAPACGSWTPKGLGMMPLVLALIGYQGAPRNSVSPSAAASELWGLSCLVHSCLEPCGSSWRRTKGRGSIPHSSYLMG